MANAQPASAPDAAAAQVVVVNHHLLMAEFVLKEDGFGELLAGADGAAASENGDLLAGVQNFRRVSELCADFPVYPGR